MSDSRRYCARCDGWFLIGEHCVCTLPTPPAADELTAEDKRLIAALELAVRVLAHQSQVLSSYPLSDGLLEEAQVKGAASAIIEAHARDLKSRAGGGG